MHKNLHRFQNNATYTPQPYLSVYFGCNHSLEDFDLPSRRESLKFSKACKYLPVSSVVNNITMPRENLALTFATLGFLIQVLLQRPFAA